MEVYTYQIDPLAFIPKDFDKSGIDKDYKNCVKMTIQQTAEYNKNIRKEINNYIKEFIKENNLPSNIVVIRDYNVLYTCIEHDFNNPFKRIFCTGLQHGEKDIVTRKDEFEKGSLIFPEIELINYKSFLYVSFRNLYHYDAYNGEQKWLKNLYYHSDKQYVNQEYLKRLNYNLGCIKTDQNVNEDWFHYSFMYKNIYHLNYYRFFLKKEEIKKLYKDDIKSKDGYFTYGNLEDSSLENALKRTLHSIKIVNSVEEKFYEFMNSKDRIELAQKVNIDLKELEQNLTLNLVLFKTYIQRL